MAAALSASDLDLLPPEPPGRAPALILSLLAHGLLVLALAWGVNWKRDPIVVFNAEIWSPTVQQAAPAPAPAEPQAEPAPKPVPKPPPAPPARELAQPREAEVALEKRRKEEARKKIEEEQARKAQKEKTEREQVEKQKAEKKRKDKERSDADLRKKWREEDSGMWRQQANTSGTQTAAGSSTTESKSTTAQSAAPSASYAGLLADLIEQNIQPPYDIAIQCKLLTVELLVITDAGGRVTQVKVEKSSGKRLCDDYVVRGLYRMQTVPRDRDGRIPGILLREGLATRYTYRQPI